jgi:hypothetical protein
MNYRQEFGGLDATPVTEPEIEAMLRGLIRHERLLGEAVRAGLKPEHFSMGVSEIKYNVLFAAMCDLTEAHGALTKAMLVTEIANVFERRSGGLMPEDLLFLIGEENSPGFIDEAFDTPVADAEKQRAERNYCEDILRRFLNARLIKNALQTALNKGISTEAVDIDELLSSFSKQSQRVRHVGAVIENAAALPEFGSPIELPPPPEPTNVPWIDSFLGGIRPGDLIGCLAPFGGGKTTMLISAAVRIAENYHLTEQNKLAVFVGFEDGADKTRHLCWSSAAHIQRSLFVTQESAKFWDNFSTATTLKDYEFKLPENQNGKIFLGERERWMAISDWYNKNFVYLDFAHSNVTSSRGGGGPAELAEALYRLQEERKCEIGFVAIDYAGLLVERMLSAEGGFAMAAKMQESMWRYIKLLPDQLRRHISDPFNATILIAHQLAPGDIRTYPPSKYVHHHDSQGGKSFAENLHSCFCLGVRDVDSRVCTIHYSKIRASLPTSPLGFIRIHDHYVDVNLVTDKYKIVGKKIMGKDEVGTFKGGEMERPAPRSGLSLVNHKPDTFGHDFLGS